MLTVRPSRGRAQGRRAQGRRAQGRRAQGHGGSGRPCAYLEAQLLALLARAHGAKVLCGARRLVSVEHKLDAPTARCWVVSRRCFAAFAHNSDVEENPGVAWALTPLDDGARGGLLGQDNRLRLCLSKHGARDPRNAVAARADNRQQLRSLHTRRPAAVFAPALSLLLPVAASGLRAEDPHQAPHLPCRLLLRAVRLAQGAAIRRAIHDILRPPNGHLPVVLGVWPRVALVGGRRRRW